MQDMTKIATCCYCGTRAVLRLRQGQHELSCTACGAPLHMMRQVKVSAAPQSEPPKKPATRKVKKAKKRRPDKKRQRTSKSRVFARFWDEVEDVFEDIFDFD